MKNTSSATALQRRAERNQRKRMSESIDRKAERPFAAAHWLDGTDCECKTWCRDGRPPLTKHHRNCPKLNLESETLALVAALIKGIENWAADEGGVHPDAWDAYCRAIVFVGDPAKLKVVLEKSEDAVPPNDPSSATR